MELAITEQRLSQRTQIIILGVAILQGVSLYWLQQSIEHEWWPDNSGAIITVLGLCLSLLPATFALTFRRSVATQSYWLSLFVLWLMLVAIGVYFGRASDLNGLVEGGGAAILAVIVLWFIVLYWFKAALHEQRVWPSYASLFGYSWHNFLCIGLAALFALISFGVLMLWGALFNVINVRFFSELFQSHWFLFPAMMLAFAYALILFRTQINAVGAVQRILRALFSILLPVLGIVATLFLLFLPVTGIDLIWAKGYGSDTLLCFVGIVLFLFNAVFQDALEKPYGDLLTRVVRLVPIVLTLLVALALYGTVLRIQQHGLTVERIWAILLVGLMAAFCVAYSFHSLVRQENWETKFASINKVMAVVIAIVCFMLVTPLIGLDKLSIANQVNRLNAGAISADDFDYAYLARLGDPGLAALESLSTSPLLAGKSGALTKLKRAIDTNGSKYAIAEDRTSEQLDAIAKSIIIYPPTADIDIQRLLKSNSIDNLSSCAAARSCALLKLDITGDGEADTVLLTPQYKDAYQASRIVEYAPGLYHNVGFVNFDVDASQLLDALTRGEVATPASAWKNLKIGEYTIKLGEPDK